MSKAHAAIVRHFFDTLPRTDEDYEAPSPPATTTPPSPPQPPPPEPTLCSICLEQMDWIQDTVVESKVR